jgi:hypothetical protein
MRGQYSAVIQIFEGPAAALTALIRIYSRKSVAPRATLALPQE